MNPNKAYKFCPRCGGKLNPQGKNLLICSNCGFNFYINAIPCSAVIIENENEEIMLVKRKFDPMKGYWDWPGGFFDGGESLENSVKREIKEELGIEIKLGKIIGVYEDTYKFQNIVNYILCTVVSAKITGGEIRALDDVSEYKYFPKNQILKQKLAFACMKKGISDYLKKAY